MQEQERGRERSDGRGQGKNVQSQPLLKPSALLAEAGWEFPGDQSEPTQTGEAQQSGSPGHLTETAPRTRPSPAVCEGMGGDLREYLGLGNPAPLPL